MSRKITWKRCVSVLIVLALAAGSMAGIGNQWAEAAARKTIKNNVPLQSFLLLLEWLSSVFIIRFMQSRISK